MHLHPSAIGDVANDEFRAGLKAGIVAIRGAGRSLAAHRREVILFVDVRVADAETDEPGEECFEDGAGRPGALLPKATVLAEATTTAAFH